MAVQKTPLPGHLIPCFNLLYNLINKVTLSTTTPFERLRREEEALKQPHAHQPQLRTHCMHRFLPPSLGVCMGTSFSLISIVALLLNPEGIFFIAFGVYKVPSNFVGKLKPQDIAETKIFLTPFVNGEGEFACMVASSVRSSMKKNVLESRLTNCARKLQKLRELILTKQRCEREFCCDFFVSIVFLYTLPSVSLVN